jgi:hypothetical protein
VAAAASADLSKRGVSTPHPRGICVVEKRLFVQELDCCLLQRTLFVFGPACWPHSRRAGAPTTIKRLARYGAPGGRLPLELAYPRPARRRAPEISWVESSRLTRSSNETHVR